MRRVRRESLIMPGEVVTIDAARALRDKGIADIPIVV